MSEGPFATHRCDESEHHREEANRLRELLGRLEASNDELHAETERLKIRQQELLETIRRISQETPLDEEVKEALEQRGTLLAEIGTLRAAVAERDRQIERTLPVFLASRDVRRDHREVFDHPGLPPNCSTARWLRALDDAELVEEIKKLGADT